MARSHYSFEKRRKELEKKKKKEAKREARAERKANKDEDTDAVPIVEVDEFGNPIIKEEEAETESSEESEEDPK